LLPVQPNQSGIGIESQFLTTLQKQTWQLHANVGAFRDSRLSSVEDGWRASLLAEFRGDRVIPGVELFVKDVLGDENSARIQLGAGIITGFDLFEIRSGIHFGLNDSAPDLEVSIWFAWKWAVAAD